MSFVRTHFKCLTVLFDPNQVPPLQVRQDLGAIAMKGYSTFPRGPAGLVSYTGHSLMEKVLPLNEDTVGVFDSPSQLG